MTKGLGDDIAKFTKATGIDKLAKKVLGDDCGCEERRKKLNQMFPNFKNIRQFTEDEIKIYDEVVPAIEKKQLTFYIVRIMLNQYQSNTSPYHKKYRKSYNEKQLKEFYIYTKEPLTKDKLKEFEDKEKRLQWIDEKLKHLSWFDVEVFKIYYRENYSLNTMSKATKINRSTLGKSIRFIKNYLKSLK